MRCGSCSMSRRQTTRTPRSQTMPMPGRAVSKCVGHNDQARGMIGDSQTPLHRCTARRTTSVARRRWSTGEAIAFAGSARRPSSGLSRHKQTTARRTTLALQLSTNPHEASLDIVHQFEHSFQLLLRVMVECSETFQHGSSVQARDARGASTQGSKRFEKVPHLRIIRRGDGTCWAPRFHFALVVRSSGCNQSCRPSRQSSTRATAG